MLAGTEESHRIVLEMSLSEFFYEYPFLGYSDRHEAGESRRGEPPEFSRRIPSGTDAPTFHLEYSELS